MGIVINKTTKKVEGGGYKPQLPFDNPGCLDIIVLVIFVIILFIMYTLYK